MFKKASWSYVLGIIIFILIASAVYVIRNFTLSNAEIGFIGAILGGLVGGSLTLLGVNLTLEHYTNEKKENEENKIKNVDRIINLLLINEMKDNMKEIKKFDKLFNLEYGDDELLATSVQRKLSFIEFEKVKFKLIETYTDNTKRIIELYEMFRMLNFTEGERKKLITEFTEIEFKFIKSQYKNGQKLIESYLK